ncbi:MAG: transcriptional repressor [Clostridia bacterium]|nr:transcriptional repressor [Clostridia bacterium]
MRKNFSRKRQVIYQALCSTKEHPSAEMLYTSLKPENPDLSLATVYRNLREFCADGTALTLGVINGHERFDGDTSRHSHFVCKSCGAVHDVEEAFPLNYMQAMEEKYGHEFEECELLFSGTCGPCRGTKQQVS